MSFPMLTYSWQLSGIDPHSSTDTGQTFSLNGRFGISPSKQIDFSPKRSSIKSVWQHNVRTIATLVWCDKRNFPDLGIFWSCQESSQSAKALRNSGFSLELNCSFEFDIVLSYILTSCGMPAAILLLG